MAKIIDDETIENVCILAKLSLTDEAKEKAKQDMQKMLDYVEKLDELDTDGVEPLSHIFGDENVFREDVVTNGRIFSLLVLSEKFNSANESMFSFVL